MSKADKLSKKEKGFAKDFIKSGNGTQSALKNYNTKSENVAGNIASENLRKPKIINYIKSIADSIPDDLLVEKHLELLTVPKLHRRYIKGDLMDEEESTDVQAIKAGLDMAYKIKGTYAPEKMALTDRDGNDLTPENQKMLDELLK